MSTQLPQLRPQFNNNLPASVGPVVLPYGMTAEPRAGAEYLHILRKYRWQILTATLITVSLVAVITFQMKPKYEAVARLEIGRENPILVLRDSVQLQENDEDYIQTQVQVLTSNGLAVETIRKLNLHQLPEFGGSPNKEAILPSLDSADSWSQQKDSPILRAFLNNLTVFHIPRSRTVEIHYLCGDAELAAQIANTLAQTYIELNFRTKYQSTRQASDWLSRELTGLQSKVEKSEQQLINYERETLVLSIPEKQILLNQKLSDLNKEQTQAETDRYRKETLYQAAREGNLDLLMSDTGRGVDLGQAGVRRLEEKLAGLRDQHAELKVQHGPNHPRIEKLASQMQETQAQLDEERQRMVRKAGADYQAALRREKLLRDALGQQQQELTQLSQLSIPYNILKREADANKQLYDGLLHRVKEAGVSAGLKSTNIRVIDPALKPLHPTKPSKTRNISLGLIFGLIIGVAYAFARERLDNTIKTPDELERVVPFPALGFIPALKQPEKVRARLKEGRKGSNGNGRNGHNGSSGSKRDDGLCIDLVPLHDPHSSIAESYRTLRTALLLSSSGQPPQVILVTSAQPQEGKTSTALNLAVSLAQRGGDVLLLDGDLRMPRIARALEMDWPYGLSNILTGTFPAEQVIFQAPEISNLYVLPSGPTPPNPAELLGSESMARLLLTLRQRFTHIVIDSPPILSITDATLLSVLVDGTIVVARGGMTTRESLRHATNILAKVNARILGILLNGVLMDSPDYYYYCYRNYGYGYNDRRYGYGGYTQETQVSSEKT